MVHGIQVGISRRFELTEQELRFGIKAKAVLAVITPKPLKAEAALLNRLLIRQEKVLVSPPKGY